MLGFLDGSSRSAHILIDLHVYIISHILIVIWLSEAVSLCFPSHGFLFLSYEVGREVG